MDSSALNSVLVQARGLILPMATQVPREHTGYIREVLTGIDRAIGSSLTASMLHDAGAYARCSYCQRYSANPGSISKHYTLSCDCGKDDGWCGSFQPPTPESSWSLGVPEEKRF